MTDLIKKLELATEGSRELDALLWAELDNRDVRQNDNNLILAKSSIPHYTTSLDAKLPWENIVQVLKTGDHVGGLWMANHEKPDGVKVQGTAHTETLARRIASLKARQ